MLGQQLDTILYHVRPGDSLSHIISRYYGPVSPQKRQTIVAQIQKDNPKVKNPNHIIPNQLLLIDIPSYYCAAPAEEKATPILRNITKQQLSTLQTQWNHSRPKGRELLAAFTPYMLGAG